MITSPIEAEYNEIEGRNEWIKAYQVCVLLCIRNIHLWIVCVCVGGDVDDYMLTMVNVQNDCVYIFVEIAWHSGFSDYSETNWFRSAYTN